MRSLAWSVVGLCSLAGFLVAGPLGSVTVAVLLTASLSPVNRSLLAVNPALTTYNADSPSGQTVFFESQTVSIPSSSGTATYVMEEGSFTLFDSDWTVLKNAQGLPSKQFGIEKVPEVELQLQLPGGAAPTLPNKFANFNAVASNGVSYTWIIQRILNVITNDGVPHKLTVSARYRLNA
jgi:hypothetical protein